MSGIPFERYLIRLRLAKTGAFHFNHGGVIHGLVKNALRSSEIPPGVIPFACESGQVSFEPGSPYNIGMTLAGEARGLFPALLAGLRRVGAEGTNPDEPLPTLGGNFSVESAALLPAPDLAAEAGACRGRAALELQLLSPLRVERPVRLVQKGRAYLDPACFDGPQFLSKLFERHTYLLKAAMKGADAASVPPVPDTVRAEAPRLLWLDVPLVGRSGAASRPKGYTLGGILGTVSLFGVPEAWIPLLVEGQYLHVGEKTRYGFGGYRIVPSAGRDAFRPARSVRERAAGEGALGVALDDTVAKSEAAGIDSVSPRDFAFARAELLPGLSAEILQGGYRPQPLLGFVARKENGGLRPLAIPTVRDRIAQRAAGSVLAPALDTLLEDCSYAYRKGFSRQGAARAIQKAYQDGFRYVLDADIETFFDAVGWDVLFGKLRALYPREPLCETLEAWVKAPVVFDGRLVERTRGLPQGSPLSPLLANLLLDELDEELLGHDYRLVRFADDFVVLCRDLDAAKRARDDAQKALAQLGLALNDEKTSIRSIDGGFGYLGYLFCRSAVVEEEHGDGSSSARVGPLAPDAVPAISWLANVPFERVRKFVGNREERAARGRALDVVPIGHKDPPGASPKRPLYVVDPDCQIELRDETLHVCEPDEPPVSLPIRLLSHVVFVGRTRLTVPVLLKLCDLGVPAYFCHRTGVLDAVFGPHKPDWPLWSAQGTFAADQAACASFIREVVAAKLHNFAALTVRMGFGRDAADAIRDLERQCANKTEPESLLGLEGSGARFYFQAAKKALSAEWHFEGREKHPSPDPVNAMLSFGYTLLYNHVGTALFAAGLNPRIGIFHQPHGAYEALTCDLQEEFRHLVDGMVWAAIHRKEVEPTDFERPPAGAPVCLMSAEARKRFIRSFEKRLMTTVTVSEGESISYAALLDRQARQVRDLVQRRIGLYEPFRTHG